MQQLRIAPGLAKPLLSLATYYVEFTAARVLHTHTVACRAKPLSTFTAEYQQCLPELLGTTAPITSHQASSVSVVLLSSGYSHARCFASGSASRLQQTANRAKRAAQLQQGSKAVTTSPPQDPASNTAADTIPQSETGVQASQARPTTLQVRDFEHFERRTSGSCS